MYGINQDLNSLATRNANDRKELTDRLDDLSHSGSSILARSQSTEERIRAVQMDTRSVNEEMRELKNLVSEALSSHSSSSCQSARKNAALSLAMPEHDDREDSGNPRIEQDVVFHPIEMSYRHIVEQDTKSQSDPEDNIDEPEYEALFRTIRGLAIDLQRYFPSLIAEYVSTQCAWLILSGQHQCLAIAPLLSPWHPAQSGLHDSEGKIRRIKQKTAARLLAMRQCRSREGLKECLETVDTELGVSESTRNEWHATVESQLLGKPALPLDCFGRVSSEDQQKDRLTRLNEWTLGVHNSLHYLELFHREFLSDLRIFPHRGIQTDRETWERLERWNDGIDQIRLADIDVRRRTIIKYWFLDSGAMTIEEYTASSLGGDESEATIRCAAGNLDEIDSPDGDTDTVILPNRAALGFPRAASNQFVLPDSGAAEDVISDDYHTSAIGRPGYGSEAVCLRKLEHPIVPSDYDLMRQTEDGLHETADPHIAALTQAEIVRYAEEPSPPVRLTCKGKQAALILEGNARHEWVGKQIV